MRLYPCKRFRYVVLLARPPARQRKHRATKLHTASDIANTRTTDAKTRLDETRGGEANEGAPNEACRRVYHSPPRIIRILIEQVVCVACSLLIKDDTATSWATEWPNDEFEVEHDRKQLNIEYFFRSVRIKFLLRNGDIDMSEIYDCWLYWLFMYRLCFSHGNCRLIISRNSWYLLNILIKNLYRRNYAKIIKRILFVPIFGMRTISRECDCLVVAPAFSQTRFDFRSTHNKVQQDPLTWTDRLTRRLADAARY